MSAYIIMVLGGIVGAGLGKAIYFPAPVRRPVTRRIV